MIAQFSIIPIGTGPSISDKVAEVIKMVDQSGLDYRASAMGTIVEGDLDDVLNLIKKCHLTVLAGCERIYTVIHIDDRKGRKGRITGKVEAVEKKAGILFKK